MPDKICPSPHGYALFLHSILHAMINLFLKIVVMQWLPLKDLWPPFPPLTCGDEFAGLEYSNRTDLLNWVILIFRLMTCWLPCSPTDTSIHFMTLNTHQFKTSFRASILRFPSHAKNCNNENDKKLHGGSRDYIS